MMADLSSVTVHYSPETVAKRKIASWPGLKIELVGVTRLVPFECRAQTPVHMLIVSERAARYDGETYVEGLPRSKRREYSRKLTFVPAGHDFHGWQQPRILTRAAYIFIDKQASWLDDELRFDEIDFRPRLYFDADDVWGTASKLMDEAASGGTGSTLYPEALGAVLSYELARLNNAGAKTPTWSRGGLAAWQQRMVQEYIEDHLAESISLAALAKLAGLSPFHFGRAFKQSFGTPPHRYHTGRRVEVAKTLLTRPDFTVNEIAMRLGFAETSAFSATFRKATGRTPSDFRRGLL